MEDRFKQYEQFIRFIGVGAVNTIIGYSIFAVSLLIGFHYTIAVLLATGLGLLFNFFSTGILVFRKNGKRFIIPFIIVNIIIYSATVMVIKILSLVCNQYAAGAIASSIMPFWGYFLNKTFVFK